ncbi:hypothetical protein KKZ42_22345, partial [Enterobacter hormaechei subsp. xiangfangensis]|nr:hypothetical protein [Enterobacter hormaechei subsp. xiangfangensis]
MEPNSFEVLPTDGVVRNGKSTAGHQRYLCSHCR